jgi:Protein of unknown function (DUF2652)
LEGDAVFAYVPEDKMSDCNAMLELIDNTYRIFRDSATDMHEHATCPCKACKAIPSLDLKFFVHHGEYVVQKVASIIDLMGNDVTLIHRLAKNHVTESTGWNGYALFTGNCLERVQADKNPFVQQAETYKHLGDVETYVMDMHVRYDELKM